MVERNSPDETSTVEVKGLGINEGYNIAHRHRYTMFTWSYMHQFR